jgi:hypothetical protein
MSHHFKRVWAGQELAALPAPRFQRLAPGPS